MSNIKNLKQRFPYQFEGENIGVDVAKGWLEFFTKLCEDIDALLGDDKQGFHWTQVKEKFGACRFYWGLGEKSSPIHVDIIATDSLIQYVEEEEDEDRKDLYSKINELTAAAQDQTKKICIICGKPGSMDNTGGYYLVLCKEHIAQRKKDPQSLESP